MSGRGQLLDAPHPKPRATRCATRGTGTPPTDRSAIERIEDVYRSWVEAHGNVPGVEVHSSDQLTWMCGPGVGWSSAAVRVRLRPAQADARLRAAVTRAFSRDRGFGVWVSDLAEPADLGSRLTRLRFRNRKRFPGMLADLSHDSPVEELPGVDVELLEDDSLFVRHPHPYFGRISTDIRRFEMRRLAHLTGLRPKRVFHIAALRGGVPIGAATLFVSGTTAAFFDVGVLESERRRGVGTHLMRTGCALARERGADTAVLLASGMGYGVYQRAGFRDVCRIAYWYSSGNSASRAR